MLSSVSLNASDDGGKDDTEPRLLGLGRGGEDEGSAWFGGEVDRRRLVRLGVCWNASLPYRN